MLGNYIYGSHGVILVYDVTNMDSFKNLEDWHELVKNTFKDKEKMPYVAMIGNKMDLNHMRFVPVQPVASSRLYNTRTIIVQYVLPLCNQYGSSQCGF